MCVCVCACVCASGRAACAVIKLRVWPFETLSSESLAPRRFIAHQPLYSGPKYVCVCSHSIAVGQPVFESLAPDLLCMRDRGAYMSCHNVIGRLHSGRLHLIERSKSRWLTIIRRAIFMMLCSCVAQPARDDDDAHQFPVFMR